MQLISDGYSSMSLLLDECLFYVLLLLCIFNINIIKKDTKKIKEGQFIGCGNDCVAGQYHYTMEIALNMRI